MHQYDQEYKREMQRRRARKADLKCILKQDNVKRTFRWLDANCIDSGQQNSGYGPGRYWILANVALVRYERGEGFRVLPDPNEQPPVI